MFFLERNSSDLCRAANGLSGHMLEAGLRLDLTMVDAVLPLVPFVGFQSCHSCDYVKGCLPSMKKYGVYSQFFGGLHRLPQVGRWVY